LPKNEDGEFELVLGNRQLLSVFFIVVILLGVFFTMGYIVGRNSSPVGGTEVASAHKPEDKPVVVDPGAPPQSAPVPPTKAPPVETAPQQPPPEQPKPVEKPKPERKAETKPPEPKPEPVKPKPREPERPPTAGLSGQPEAGQTYLQLAATSQHEANIEVDVLRKKGFRALAAEIPEKPGTFRVLVGPLAEGATNKTKADLQSAGFPGQKAIKRTY
jgi:outer membrane biosynthesis protein TonB